MGESEFKEIVDLFVDTVNLIHLGLQVGMNDDPRMNELVKQCETLNDLIIAACLHKYGYVVEGCVAVKREGE